MFWLWLRFQPFIIFWRSRYSKNSFWQPFSTDLLTLSAQRKRWNFLDSWVINVFLQTKSVYGVYTFLFWTFHPVQWTIASVCFKIEVKSLRTFRQLKCPLKSSSYGIHRTRQSQSLSPVSLPKFELPDMIHHDNDNHLLNWTSALFVSVGHWICTDCQDVEPAYASS